MYQKLILFVLENQDVSRNIVFARGYCYSIPLKQIWIHADSGNTDFSLSKSIYLRFKQLIHQFIVHCKSPVRHIPCYCNRVHNNHSKQAVI